MTANVVEAQDAQLIWELTADITSKAQVLMRYGMTVADLRQKMRDPMFRGALSEARKLWNSDLNVKQRVSIKAGFIIEDSLIDLLKMIKDVNMPPAARLDAFKKVAEVSQMLQQQKNADVEKHVIQINVGGQAPVVISAQKEPITHEPA
jgi:hypothetical protein